MDKKAHLETLAKEWQASSEFWAKKARVKTTEYSAKVYARGMRDAYSSATLIALQDAVLMRG